eukprot:Transcript_12032.p2 GENE.Transcript_12032~~Transcript_12032.p2  ORF type:complete len:303 (+),score=86.66 Transcript_12032:60-911(+)
MLRSLATRSRLAAFSATRAPLLRTASLCDSANRPRQFDPLGRPDHELAKDAKGGSSGRDDDDGIEGPSIDAPRATPRRPRGSFSRAERGGGFGGGGGFQGRRAPVADADMLAFQAYVRERLAKMEEQMYPSGRTTRAKAELAWLEEQVAEDEMNKNRRRFRDPLIDVDKSEITHTNLPLLNRFVSDNGSILPSKLTGVKMIKQRRLAKAIKRAQHLALMPKIWKLPQYRHATYADDFSRPENPRPPENDDEDFREPADLRYPGQLESAEPSLGLDLAWIAKTK